MVTKPVFFSHKLGVSKGLGVGDVVMSAAFRSKIVEVAGGGIEAYLISRYFFLKLRTMLGVALSPGDLYTITRIFKSLFMPWMIPGL